MKNERALSENVSVILIILLVLVLAIVAAASLFGLTIFQQKSAFIVPNFSHQAVAGKETIDIFNRGGDTAYLNLSSPALYPIGVYADTTFGVFRVLPLAGVDKFSPGTTFYLFYNSTTGLFNLTDTTGGLTGAAAQFPNSVTGVHLVDEKAHLLIAQYGTPGMPAAGLSVLSVFPGSGFNDSSSVSLAINGTGFYPGATVRLNQTGVPDILATGVSVVNSSKLTCSVVIKNAPAGLRNVVVTVPDGRSAMLANGFTVNQSLPAPTVTAITNATGNRGWPWVMRITGTNFVSGATSFLNRTGGPVIPATSCSFVSATQLVCTYNLADALVGGSKYNIVVTNIDGKSGLLAGAFTLSSPAPTITSSTPATGAQAATVIITNLKGTNFQPGATVTYVQGGTLIPLTGVAVVSATQITGTLAIPSNAPAGSYNVTVTNTDGQLVTKANTFTVTSNAPTVTGITPATGKQGWPVSITNLAGTNFQAGATATLNRTGYPDIAGTSVVVVSATKITCFFDLSGTTAGIWNVTVTNPDGKSGSRTSGFTVTNTAPAITSSTPNSGLQGATVSITNLLGTNFQPGATVTYDQGATSIPITGVMVVSATQITGTLVIPDFAPTGAYSVTVTNPDGGTVTRASTFTVNSNTPTVSSILPASGNRGWPVSITNLKGTNFQPGATATLRRAGFADISGSGVTVVSATQITCTFDLLGKQSGTWNVTVTNPDGKTGVRANGFTVSAPTPTLTGITPNSGARGTTVTIANLAGTGFQPGATITFTRAPTTITMTDVSVVLPTQITGTLVIPAGATTGSYSIKILNTDGTTRTTALFTVT